MDRRRFFSLLGLGIAGIALEQAIPLGRVWSFPKKIVIAADFGFRNSVTVVEEFRNLFPVGSLISVRIPQRYVVTRHIEGHLFEVTEYPGAMPFKIVESKTYCGLPPG